MNTLDIIASLCYNVAMSEYNTKITYYKDGKLNLKKTARSYSKFYFAYYGKIAVNQLKQRIHSEGLTETIN